MSTSAFVTESKYTVLQETPSLSLGKVLYAARSHDGRTIVADAENARVWEVSPGGSLRARFGRRGDGPGEFESPGALALLAADSVVVVTDGSLRRATLYDLKADTILRVEPIPTPQVGLEWNASGDSVATALVGSPNILMLWNWRRGMPAVLGNASPHVMSDLFTVLQHGRPEVVRTDSGYIGLLPAEPGLHLFDRQGNATGFVDLPAAHRRGVPRDLYLKAAARQRDPGGPQAIEPVGSMALGLHRLSSGHLVAVFLDVSQVAPVRPGGRGASTLAAFQLYATALSPDLSTVCEDQRIPLQTDVVPVPFFLADTMFVLAKEVTPGDSVVTSIRAFQFNTGACKRSPTGGRRAARLTATPPS